MRCNQISATKDKPSRYSMEIMSFRLVQFCSMSNRLRYSPWKEASVPAMFHARLVAARLTVYIATNIKSKYLC